LSGGDPAGRWRILALLSGAELAGMSLWFTASAAAPLLRDAWTLSPTQEVWLTNGVQLGFVAGTAASALLNLADIVRARTLFAVSALAAALANGLLLVAPGFAEGVVLRFLTGAFLAGVYPPAMKMAATWFRDGRGLAIGTIVGALTVGKATPYLLHGVEGLGLPGVIGGASIAAACAGLLVRVAYRDGPFAFESRPFDWGLVGVVARHRPTRLAIYGYLGHMWELYAMWVLVTVFFRDVLAERGGGSGAALGAGLIGFAVIAAGGPGSVVAGRYADRLGRERIAGVAMAVSGACSLTLGWLAGAPLALLVPLALVWGFAVVADSAQFSALVTEVAPPHAVGTALTLQTSAGFALTIASIWLATELARGVGWGPAFTVLAIGPALGIVAMARLAAHRRGARASVSVR
jgi:MFS family permease